MGIQNFEQKISITTENIELNIQNAEVPKINYHIIYYILEYILTRLTEGVLEAIQLFNLLRYPHDRQMVGSPIQHSSPREKEKKGESFHKTCICT